MSTGCHVSCLAVVDAGILQDLLKATAVKCEPPPREDERRAKWLREDQARVFFQILRGRIPLEVCLQISKNIFREHSVQLARDAWSQPRAGIWEFATIESIYASYVNIEGRRYLRSLSNKQEGDCTQLFHQGRSGVFLGTMYVAEDHLGIRRVMFDHSAKHESCPAPVVDVAPGIWWRTFRLWDESQWAPDYFRILRTINDVGLLS